MPGQVKKCLWRMGKIFIGAGTTNLQIAELLLGTKFEPKEEYVAGLMFLPHVPCITDPTGTKKLVY